MAEDFHQVLSVFKVFTDRRDYLVEFHGYSSLQVLGMQFASCVGLDQFPLARVFDITPELRRSRHAKLLGFSENNILS